MNSRAIVLYQDIQHFRTQNLFTLGQWRGRLWWNPKPGAEKRINSYHTPLFWCFFSHDKGNKNRTVHVTVLHYFDRCHSHSYLYILGELIIRGEWLYSLWKGISCLNYWVSDNDFRILDNGLVTLREPEAKNFVKSELHIYRALH